MPPREQASHRASVHFVIDVRRESPYDARDDNQRAPHLSKENTILWFFGVDAARKHMMLWFFGALPKEGVWNSTDGQFFFDFARAVADATRSTCAEGPTLKALCGAAQQFPQLG